MGTSAIDHNLPHCTILNCLNNLLSSGLICLMADNETPFFLPFAKKEKLTNDTYTFYFKRTGEERDFIAGQYYEIKLKIKKPDERGNAHVFTISSSPTDKDYITITTRIIRSTFKLKLDSLKKGELTQFNGPWDDLNFDEKDTSPHVFLAGGIGITPYHSIIQYCLDEKIETQMTLFASWKSKDEIIFDDFFKDAVSKLPNFKYIVTITDEESLKNVDWNGETGRVNGDMIKKHIADIKNSKYFISGPQVMVNALKKTVQEMGVSKEKIIAEEFEGY